RIVAGGRGVAAAGCSGHLIMRTMLRAEEVVGVAVYDQEEREIEAGEALRDAAYTLAVRQTEDGLESRRRPMAEHMLVGRGDGDDGGEIDFRGEQRLQQCGGGHVEHGTEGGVCDGSCPARAGGRVAGLAGGGDAAQHREHDREGTAVGRAG
ncbi:hypothetical protein B1218_35495, partial [Pseudomonas ogarae]